MPFSKCSQYPVVSRISANGIKNLLNEKIFSKIFGGIKIFVFLQPVSGLADLAQLAERKLPKLQVAGSSPVIRSGRGSLAQLVQSACLTSRRSLVRTQQFPPNVETSRCGVSIFLSFKIRYTRRIKKYTENKIFLL